MKVPTMLLALVLQLLRPALAADTMAWKSRNIYFAVTDRIARNSTDNGGGACNNLGTYCGGTFRGLESKLDYIKGMGFDAIWITPIVENHDGGYHGYWARDLYKVNPNHGTADDLKSLVRTAHEKDIYIMVDVVVNHMGPGAIADNRPEPLNQETSYHWPCEINYNDQGSVEYCRIAGLPDVNTEDPKIRTLFQDWVKWLVKEYQFDGVRVDTVKHVAKGFWQDFSSAAGVYTIGEVFNGDLDYLSSYARVMPGLLNYAIYYPLNNFYQQKGSSQALVSMHDAIGVRFPDPTTLGTFVDNHDNARWLSQKNDVTLLKNALTYVLLARGIPIVYYGTEQGYAGGDDPANREDLWRSKFNTRSDLYQFISRVSAVRKATGGLPHNDHEHLMVEDTGYAWSRDDGDVIALTSNIGSGNSRRYCFYTKRQNGKWKSVFGGDVYTADEFGHMCATVVDGKPVILVAQ